MGEQAAVEAGLELWHLLGGGGGVGVLGGLLWGLKNFLIDPIFKRWDRYLDLLEKQMEEKA